MTEWNDRSRGGVRGHFFYAGENPPEIPYRPDIVRSKMISGGLIHYYLKDDISSDIEIEISNLQNDLSRKLKGSGKAGIHRLHWDFRFDVEQAVIDKFKAVGDEKLTAILALPNVSNGHKTILNELKSQLQSTNDAEVLEEISEKVYQMYQNERDMREYRLGSINGKMARPGFYTVRTNVAGQSYSQIIEIREDPMEGW